MGKRVFNVVMALVIGFSVCLFSGCAKKASDFTEEEHLKRVTERIEKEYLTDSEKYTGVAVYPLYDENDQLTHFLAEFEPQGFAFVELRDEHLIWLVYKTGMYKLSSDYMNRTWSPYTVDETNSQPEPDTDKCWIPDENGEKINYDKSPYYVTKNIDERKYLLRSTLDSGECVCAIKKENTFINLISSTEVNVENGDLSKKQATLYITFIAKPLFDL